MWRARAILSTLLLSLLSTAVVHATLSPSPLLESLGVPPDADGVIMFAQGRVLSCSLYFSMLPRG